MRHKLQKQSEIILLEIKLLDALDNYVRAVRFRADKPIITVLREEIKKIKKEIPLLQISD